MFPICDLFKSIQGEGKYMGVPSIFIRVSGCNLRCVFKDSICDTPYSSFKPERSKYTVEDVLSLINDNPHIHHVVITGGEPLLYRNDIEFRGMIRAIYNKLKFITIETNGTLPPLSYGYEDELELVDLYSISPKLSTSVGSPGQTLGNGIVLTEEMVNKHNSQRINLTNLMLLTTCDSDYQFKFVYSNEDCVREIKELYNSIYNHARMLCSSDDVDTTLKIYAKYFLVNGSDQYQLDDIINTQTYLMPEGITVESINSKRAEIIYKCIENGWNFTDRLHIQVWGDKRGF